jgi:hypothetical protein
VELEEEMAELVADVDTLEVKAEALAAQLSSTENVVRLLEAELREALELIDTLRGEARQAKEDSQRYQSMQEHLQLLVKELESSRRTDPLPTTPSTLKRLRQAVYRAQQQERFSFSLSCVERVCKESGAMSELARVQAMLSKKTHSRTGTTASTGSGLSVARAARTNVAERRVSAAFFIDLGATSERFTALRKPLDSVFDHTKESQEFAAGTGIGQSLSSRRRAKAQIRKTYALKLTAELTRQSGWNGSGSKVCLIILWDDDFTRHWTHLVFGSGKGRQEMIQWTVIALKVQPTIEAPRVHPTIPYRNPEGLSPSTVDWVRAPITLAESFISLVTARVPEMMGTAHEDGLFNTGAIRGRCLDLSYSIASEAFKARKMDKVMVLDILTQAFRAYMEFGRSILRQLLDPVIWTMLESGILIPSVGDYPKFARESMLLQQGDGRHPEGPAYLGRLLQACSADLWQQLVVAHEMQEWPESKVRERVGKAAGNIVQEMGPLHPKINGCKDAGEFHRATFLGPLFKLATGVNIQKKMHLRQIVGLEEALLAAWFRLRATARPLLLALPNRVDASAMLWFFENTLAMPTILYDVIFKSAKPDEYYWGLTFALFEVILRQRHNYPDALLRKIDTFLYLQRTGHPLFNVLGRNCHVVDEAFGEGGVNALLHGWVRGIWSEVIARNTALRRFANRTDAGVRAAREGFVLPDTIRCSVTGRPMEDMIRIAMQIIVEAIERLYAAQGNELPRLVAKGTARRTFRSDAWICRALTQDDTKLFSHEFASPAWALFAEDKCTARPDVTQSPNGCNVLGCGGARDARLLTLECGHSICSSCNGNVIECTTCRNEYGRLLNNIVTTIRNTQLTRVIRVDELKMSAAQSAPDLGEPIEEHEDDDGDEGGGGDGDGDGDGGGDENATVADPDRLRRRLATLVLPRAPGGDPDGPAHVLVHPLRQMLSPKKQRKEDVRSEVQVEAALKKKKTGLSV